jgi:hypothetical protein
MRRSLLASIGAAAVFILAACSPDQASQRPLSPTGPSLAQSQQCRNTFAKTIEDQQVALFSGTALTTLQTLFSAIKSNCPNVSTAQLLGYLGSVADFGAPTVGNTNTTNRGQALVDHWSAVVLYVTNQTETWPAAVLTGDALVGGVPDGGAKVLYPGDAMTTFDGQAGLSLPSNLTSPTGPHLFTFQPVAGSQCDGGTSLRINGRCYDVHDYPDGGTYSPPATLTLCLHQGAGETSIGHARAGFGTEVLPGGLNTSFSCAHDAETQFGALLKRGGPLGRALAHAYDYLAPRPLFADDAGESGSIGLFSLVGGVLNDIFADNFDDPTDFNDGVDTPDLGDAWTINATSPGYIQIQDALGGLSGGVVVLSQAQGNCANCPIFRLLGTRVNSTENESVGSYDVTWDASQTKPNVKEAPYVVYNKDAVEIARVSYVTISSQNKILLTVNKPGPNDDVYEAGTWVTNTPQTFKLTVNLTVLGSNDQTVSLAIGPVGGALTTYWTNKPAPFATSLKQMGYVLTGIDAGIIASDNWKTTRLADQP